MESEPKSKELHISGTVFVWGCFAMVLVALAVATICIMFATTSLHNERDLALRTAELEQRLAVCTLDGARLHGRVMTFERSMISPKRTAIEASLEEFIQISSSQGGEDTPVPTVDQFKHWLRVTH